MTGAEGEGRTSSSWGLREPRSEPRRRVALGGDRPASRVSALDTARRWAFIAVLAWSPLPLGSDRPWAWSLLGGLIVILLGFSSTLALVEGAEPVSLRRLRVPLILGALLAAWILLQNLPGGVFGWHHPLWDKAAEVLGRKLSPSLSIDREASRIHLFRLFTDAGFFFLAWQIGRRASGAALIVRSIAIMGAVYALYGIVEFASPHPAILWMRKWAYTWDVTSTFVNRNSFATFAGLATLAGLTLIAGALIRHTDTRSRTTFLLSVVDTLLWRGTWPVIAVVVTGPAVLLSHSRGGMFASFCGILALGAAMRAAPSLALPARRAFIWFLVGGSLIGLIVAGSATLDRVADTNLSTANTRAVILGDTLPAVADNWLGGTGLGTFRFIYPMYETLETDALVDLAHNDYLENLLELGVPAALLLFALVGWLAGECALGLKQRRKDALYPCLGFAASVLVGVHSLFDFSLQIPAVAALYATLLGIGVAQSESSRAREEGPRRERS